MDSKCMALINRYYEVPGVYCLTYEPTGSKYIGSSIKIGCRVWNGILNYNSLVINKDLRHLKLSVLETIKEKDIDLLRELEEKWINKLNTYFPFGMNIMFPTDLSQKIERCKINPKEEIYRQNKIIVDSLYKFRITCSVCNYETNTNPKPRKPSKKYIALKKYMENLKQ